MRWTSAPVTGEDVRMANVLLGASASVAIYKSCDLASKLTQRGHSVRVVLTRRAAELVSPQLFEAVTGQPAHVDEFGSDRYAAMDHIDLAKWGDALIVAPASADLIGRMANGIANDLLSTVAIALAQNKPRLLAPAMNPAMLVAPAVQRNIGRLREDGWRVLDPDEGAMACGDIGPGRLPEPAQIAEVLEALLGR
jgi:phosphopantothenoylcysteine decarboxylase/phosphopantothenate--cysteine ligase